MGWSAVTEVARSFSDAGWPLLLAIPGAPVGSFYPLPSAKSGTGMVTSCLLQANGRSSS